MNDEFKLYVACLEFLGISLDIKTFQNRIKIQKLAYLLGKIFKWKFIDNFHYYIRGPYSTELAKCYYSDEYSSQSNISISNKMRDRLESIHFLSNSNTIMLEIMASLLYLQESFDEEAAEEQLKKIKPYLKIRDIWRGTQLLKQLKLTKADAEDIMKDLKKELDEWDNASSEDFENSEK